VTVFFWPNRQTEDMSFASWVKSQVWSMIITWETNDRSSS